MKLSNSAGQPRPPNVRPAPKRRTGKTTTHPANPAGRCTPEINSEASKPAGRSPAAPPSMTPIYGPLPDPSTPFFANPSENETTPPSAALSRRRLGRGRGNRRTPLPRPATGQRTGRKRRRRREDAAPSGRWIRERWPGRDRLPSSALNPGGHLLPQAGEGRTASAVQETAVAVGAGMGAGRTGARSRASAERHAGQGEGDQGDTKLHDDLATGRSKASRPGHVRETITKAEWTAGRPDRAARQGACSPLPSWPARDAKRRISQERNRTTASSRSSGAVTR